ncbi:MAG: tetratricopeptide repeat protein [Pyrinomonadaceae bacterium]
MKKVTPQAVLFIIVLTSLSAPGQIGNSSQVPRAVANSATNASASREKSESTDVISEKTRANDRAQKYYESGNELYTSGKFGEAIEAFKQATKLQSDNPQNHYMLGMAYFESKAYKESFDSFKRAIRAWPDWPQAHFRLGVASYVLGRKSESIQAYNHLRRLESPLASSLSRILKEDKNLPEGATANDSSLTQIELVRAAAPGKEEAMSAQVGAESRSASASPANVKETAPIAGNPPAATGDSPDLTGIYRIGVGDVLDIRLLNSSSARSTLYTVVDGGLIDLAIAGGPIAVAGLTVDEVQALLIAELKRRAVEQHARVSVGVRQYASHSVVITGVVNNPGMKFLRREAIPLYVIMAEAQARSDANRVAIMRPGMSAVILDLDDPAALNFQVRHSDMINVTVRPQEFYYIGGRINHPGQKVFQPDITLLQAILAAGGLRRQNENLIEVSREGGDGRLTTIRFKLKEIKAGKIADPKLQPGDRVEVIR